MQVWTCSLLQRDAVFLPTHSGIDSEAQRLEPQRACPSDSRRCTRDQHRRVRHGESLSDAVPAPDDVACRVPESPEP